MIASAAQLIDSSPITAGRHYGSLAGSGDDAAVLTLDHRGIIRDSNCASEMLFKYSHRELVWRHVSILLPQLADMDLMQSGQPNPRLSFLCRIGHHFQAVTQDGERFAGELFLNLLNQTGHSRLSLIVRPQKP